MIIYPNEWNMSALKYRLEEHREVGGGVREGEERVGVGGPGVFPVDIKTLKS